MQLTAAQEEVLVDKDRWLMPESRTIVVSLMNMGLIVPVPQIHNAAGNLDEPTPSSLSPEGMRIVEDIQKRSQG